MELIWILSGIGVVIGLALSSFLGIYNEHAISIYSRSYFGIPANDLIFYLVILFGVPGLVVLITLSIIVKDLEYPNALPFNFTIETLMMAFLPSIGVLLIPKLRGYEYTTETIYQFVLTVLRFGVLHILLQFSGFWSDLFPPLENKTE